LPSVESHLQNRLALSVPLSDYPLFDAAGLHLVANYGPRSGDRVSSHSVIGHNPIPICG
jgi:hypothetical protein